jgi:signal transduction histidine kinase
LCYQSQYLERDFMRESAAENLARSSRQGFPITIATMRANPRERQIAFGGFLILVVVIAITLPFANIQLPRVDAFVPVIQTVMCLADFLTAVFLFAQYSVQPQLALLVLASGFVFSGLFAFLQTLAFPGAYAPAGLIGDGLNSPGWLFVLWQTTFPSAVILYALLKEADEPVKQSGQSIRATIFITVACVATVTAGLTWLATAGAAHLPSLYVNEMNQAPTTNYVDAYLSLLSAAAILLLFVRRRTVLDQWLIVTLLAWLPNFVVSVLFTVVRFTLGWYLARIYALIAGSALLFVLLFETVVLYARLANTIVLLQRERETKLMSAQAITAAIAHEIRQPLTRITAGGGAAQRYLEMVPPQHDKAKAALAGVVNAGHSTSKVIDGFRSLFNKADEEQEQVDMNELIPEVLESLNSQLKDHRVSIRVDLTPKLPAVTGNRGQLQEVLSNLITNGIEAMETTTVQGRLLLIRTEIRGDEIAVAVEDSGPGINKDQLDDIFTAFVTTKRHGMGLGLAISRMIIEYHGGKLTAASDSKHGGASFQFVLPIADRR